MSTSPLGTLVEPSAGSTSPPASVQKCCRDAYATTLPLSSKRTALMMVSIQPPGWFKKHAGLRFRHLDHLVWYSEDSTFRPEHEKKSSEFNSELNSEVTLWLSQTNGIWQPQFWVIRIHQVGGKATPASLNCPLTFHPAPFEVLLYCLTGNGHPLGKPQIYSNH